jgi:hypothetical protein
MAVGLNKLDNTQRMIDLLRAVLEVISYSFWTYSALINLPYYVLQTYYVC